MVIALLLVFNEPSFSSHTVVATPPGGIYNSPQSIILESIEPTVIYYTTDGSEPTVNSTQYDGTPTNITTTTVMKFFAYDSLGNHSSDIVTENYSIVPVVINTTPEDGDTAVNLGTAITATFSESMDEGTIDNESFLVTDEFGNIISGSITYEAGSNTATFTPDISSTPLTPVTVYVVTLTTAITDSAGNPLAEDYSWNFSTAGEITISINDENFAPIGGSAFMFTPDPFTLADTLEVADNSELDSDSEIFGEQMDGVIVIRNVAVTSYVVKQTVVPDGFTQLYDNIIVTVHPTVPSALLVIQNLNSTIEIDSLTQFIDVPSPFLNNSQFELYNGNALVGIYQGVPGQFPDNFQEITTVDSGSLQAGRLLTQTTLSQARDPPLQSVIFFNLAASATLEGSEIIEAFQIPTFPHPMEAIVSGTVYAVPAFVIPYEESSNNFVLTPVISKIFPGMTIRMDQASFVESKVSKVEQVNMTFNAAGNNVGFSFGISDTPPPGTPEPPFDASALFLDVGFVGDVDFSDPNTFQTSPKIDILVNKTLPGFPELPNGCPDFVLLFFDGTEWVKVQKLNPTGNFTDACPFTLEPEHFSKFGVGGVKGQTISTEDPPSTTEEKHRGGSGGARSSSIQQITSGTDVESEARVGSDSVIVSFDSVEPGSGQLKISTIDVDTFPNMFDDLVSQEGNKVGMVGLDGSTFSTVGKIFDIDASAVKFNGMVKVAIPYDEQIAQSSASESNVRFLHYDKAADQWQDVTITVDTTTDTVTGLLDVLSPVVAATVNDGTFPSTYFGLNPLSKLVSTNPSEIMDNVHIGQQVSIALDIRNVQRLDQKYTAIVQILDKDGVARNISMEEGMLERGQGTEVASSWLPDEEGNYTVQVFVWDKIINPSALSRVIVSKILVSN